MNAEILDYALHHHLHKLIAELPIQQQIQLKTLKLCGTQIPPRKGVPNSVYVATNGRRARFVGQSSCKNTWACPVCSAYMMSKYATEISAAIDMMRKEGNMAFMVTLTVPHLKFMSCREVTEILYKTYSYFRRTAKQKRYEKKADGTVRSDKGTASAQFFRALDIEYFVSVCEYTWGEHGWHPHFHILLWTKKENRDKILEWQEKLNEFWLHTAKRITLEETGKMFTADRAEKIINYLYDHCQKDAGVFISNDNGVVRESLTSEYIAGWGADKEMTGNVQKKASHKGHLTPYQILERSYYGDKKMSQLYIEFCLQVTRKPVHHRVCWSKNGFKPKILQYIQCQKAQEFLKKKDVESTWQVVCYFTYDEWSKICYENIYAPVKANILYMAIHAPDILQTYLQQMGIRYRTNDKTSQLIEEIINQAV